MTILYLLLTGDIGGTNSRMSLYDATSTNTNTNNTNTNTNTNSITPKPIRFQQYRNAEHITQQNVNEPDVFVTRIILPFLHYCFANQKHANDDIDEFMHLPSIDVCNDDDIRIIVTLAVAGMVVNNCVHLTNLWNMMIDGNAIGRNSTTRSNNNGSNNINSTNPYLQSIVSCSIINDFVAQGYGCLTLQPHEVRHLYGSSAGVTTTNVTQLPVGPKVCIGAGTGLGECYLTPNTTTATTTTDTTADTTTSSSKNETVTYTCYASEGGHVEYAPRNDIEIQMFKHLSTNFSTTNDRISVERVVSGKGLANVYEFLSITFPTRIVRSVHDAFLTAGDEQGRVVSQGIGICTLCQQAMSIMMSAYGCETGNVAIKFIPTGGLFVTGGLTPKNIQYIDGLHTDFMISYLNKGRVSPILERIPLFAVLVEDLGVRGAHKAAHTEYESYRRRHYHHHHHATDNNGDGTKFLHRRFGRGSMDDDNTGIWWMIGISVVVTVAAAVLAGTSSSAFSPSIRLGRPNR